MFTGIVAAIGNIIHLQPLDQGLRLTIDAPDLDLNDVALGDSIAHNGVCLTVIEIAGSRYKIDVSRETLNCTTGLDARGEVNLEKALRLADRLGGHLVSGHVDGLGTVMTFEPVGESHLLVIRAPQALARYIARKGSIAVNGVSLTTNTVHDVGTNIGTSTDTGDTRNAGTDFSINLIPHTVTATTLRHLKPGSLVNLEVDLIARYCERML
ncbi:MAG: riboflavin synthase [Sterolibacterium sp.]|nr:riboflavin synthase [Sterolibacterium sp.]